MRSTDVRFQYVAGRRAAFAECEAEIMRLRERNTRLTMALKPFVEFFDDAMQGEPHGFEERHSDDLVLFDWNDGKLQLGHFTDAKAALEARP